MASNSEQTDMNELQYQNMIDKAMITAGLPQNKLNSLIALAKDKITCDSDCQKERTSQELKKKLDLIQNSNYEKDMEEAEKNYYISTNGEAEYNELLLARNIKKATEFIKNQTKDHLDIVKNIIEMIKNLETKTVYTKRMNELLAVKLRKKTQIEKNIDKYISTVQTTDRRVDYELKDMDWNDTFNKILKIIYYGILVLYILFGDYLPTRKYMDFSIWLLIVLYIALPYGLNPLVKRIYNLIF
jgi:predicted nucleic acid-binding protein